MLGADVSEEIAIGLSVFFGSNITTNNVFIK
jgi:hypothetical protein